MCVCFCLKAEPVAQCLSFNFLFFWLGVKQNCLAMKLIALLRGVCGVCFLDLEEKNKLRVQGCFRFNNWICKVLIALIFKCSQGCQRVMHWVAF